jgi:hypothetical protein
MGHFTTAGQHKVKVIEVGFCESFFNQNDPESVDIAIKVESLDGECQDWWKGELSQRYCQGNASDKMQWEMTLASLKKIGWEHDAVFNETTMQSLVGQEIEVGVAEREKDGKTYFDVKYLGESTFGPKMMDADDAKARVAALFGATGGGDAAAAPAGEAGAPTGGGNPFAEETEESDIPY